jgi:hypothetical protein
MANGQGGLAAVTEEEVVGPPQDPAIDVSEIVERTASPGTGQSLTSMILNNRQRSIGKLKDARKEIGERRVAQQKRDEQSKWFALAQGMLAPTQAGSFGESLGTSAGLLNQQTEMRSEHEAQFDAQLDNNAAQEIALESEAIDQMLKMTGYAAGNRAKSLHGAIQTMTAPEDKNRPVNQRRIIFGAVSEGPDGQPIMTPLKDANGDYWLAASKLDPDRVAALMEAAEEAESRTGRSQGQIANAYGLKAPLINIRRANALFENADVEIKTSGINQFKNKLANIFGVDLGDTVELSELQMVIADQYLSRLEKLKGSSSDRDVMEMKGISATLGGNTEANYRALKRMEAVYSAGIRRGIRESYQTEDMDGVFDLWESAEGFRWIPGAKPISTKADYDKLNVGDSFFAKGDWGGEVRTKTEE